jgi:hypothetical protein
LRTMSGRQRFRGGCRSAKFPSQGDGLAGAEHVRGPFDEQGTDRWIPYSRHDGRKYSIAMLYFRDLEPTGSYDKESGWPSPW